MKISKNIAGKPIIVIYPPHSSSTKQKNVGFDSSTTRHSPRGGQSG